MDPQAVRLEVEPPSDNVILPLDVEQMCIVFGNLVRNAGEAGASTVRISVRSSEEGAFAAGRRVQVVVSDDGPGIPEKALEKVFKPFFTTRADGTGMGLAIVERIVALHGGRIAASSEEGEGTTFLISLFVPEQEEDGDG